MGVCTWWWVRVHICPHACGGRRIASAVISEDPSSLFMRHVFHSLGTLSITRLNRSLGLGDPPVSTATALGLQVCSTTSDFLNVTSGDRTQDPMLVQQTRHWLSWFPSWALFSLHLWAMCFLSYEMHFARKVWQADERQETHVTAKARLLAFLLWQYPSSVQSKLGLKAWFQILPLKHGLSNAANTYLSLRCQTFHWF